MSIYSVFALKLKMSVSSLSSAIELLMAVSVRSSLENRRSASAVVTGIVRG